MTMHRNHVQHWTDRGRMRQQSSRGDSPPIDSMWHRDIGFSSMSWGFPPFPPGHPGEAQEAPPPPPPSSMAPMLPIMPMNGMMPFSPAAFAPPQPMIMPPPFQNPSNFMFPPFPDFMMAPHQPQPPIEQFPPGVQRITAVATPSPSPSPPNTPEAEKEEIRLATEKSIVDEKRRQRKIRVAQERADADYQLACLAQIEASSREAAEWERNRKGWQEAVEKAEADAKEQIDRAKKSIKEAKARADAAEQKRKDLVAQQAAEKAKADAKERTERDEAIAAVAEQRREEQAAEQAARERDFQELLRIGKTLEESEKTKKEEDEKRRRAEVEASKKRTPQPTVRTTETGILKRFPGKHHAKRPQPPQPSVDADHELAADLQDAWNLQAGIDASRAENHAQAPYTTETFIERTVTPAPRHASPRHASPGPSSQPARTPTPPEPRGPARPGIHIARGRTNDVGFSADETSDDEVIRTVPRGHQDPGPSGHHRAGGAAARDREERFTYEEERRHEGQRHEEHRHEGQHRGGGGAPREERRPQQEAVYVLRGRVEKERPRAKPRGRHYMHEAEVIRDEFERGWKQEAAERKKRWEREKMTERKGAQVTFVTPSDEAEMERATSSERGTPEPRRRRPDSPRPQRRDSSQSEGGGGRSRSPYDSQGRERVFVIDEYGRRWDAYQSRNGDITKYALHDPPRPRAPQEPDNGRRRDPPRPILVRRKESQDDVPAPRRTHDAQYPAQWRAPGAFDPVRDMFAPLGHDERRGESSRGRRVARPADDGWVTKDERYYRHKREESR